MCYPDVRDVALAYERGDTVALFAPLNPYRDEEECKMAPCLSDVIYLVPQLQVTQLQCREEGRGPLNSQNRCLTVRLLCNHLFLL